jgi:methylmalonyl-CoA/ethylmalonyl-CoA epimerase
VTSSIASVSLRGIHHVAMAVRDLDEAIETYERLFAATVEHRGPINGQGVEAAYLRVGSDRVELLAATGEDTPVGRFLAKRGPGMHHVAFATDDVESELRTLAAGGARLVDEHPRPGLAGLQTAFVHPDTLYGVLTEVVSGG